MENGGSRKSSKYMDCYDPSTGEVIAQAPQCTAAEVEAAVAAAAGGLPGLGRHPAEQAGAGAVQDEGAAGRSTWTS